MGGGKSQRDIRVGRVAILLGQVNPILGLEDGWGESQRDFRVGRVANLLGQVNPILGLPWPP